MTFPRYPQYKNSGMEWLEELPEEWRVFPLKHLAIIDNSGCFGVEPEGAEIVLPVATTAQIDPDGHFEVCEMPQRGFSTSEVERYGCSAGQILVVKSSGSATNIISGKAGLVDESTQQFVFSNFLMRVRPDFSRLNPKFAFYLLRSHLTRQRVELMCSTTTYPNLKVGEYVSAPLPVPTLTVQDGIVCFLDREIANIDALMEKQQKLMELLKEKRQSFICNAVTKGLNAGAPMKDSGIAWLGEVPAHWELKRLKYLGEAITGLTYDPAGITDEASGTLVLRSSNVQEGRVVMDDNVFVSSNIPEELFTRPGDILICSRNGSRALIGKNATIDERSAGVTFGAFMTVFRSPHSLYLACVLNSPLFEFQSGAFLTSTINQLTIGVLNNFEVPFPPEMERKQIGDVVRREVAKLDELATVASQAISLLRERRTALISATVTGQIDVRQFRNTQASA